MLKNLFIKYKEIILYVIAGGMTTLVYFVTRFGLHDLGTMTSQVIANVVAVTFAYIVNKLFVFKSKTKTPGALVKEAFLFYSARGFSFALDFFIALIFVKLHGIYFAHLLNLDKIDYSQKFFQLPIVSKVMGDELIFNEFIFTVISQVLILTANYLFSKLVIFRKKRVE
jgi:putative flippase GtrA